MRPFDYLEPTTLDEALAVLAADGDEAMVIAGGSAVALLLKQGLVAPARLLSLRGLKPLAAIDRDEGILRIGATATHAAAAASPSVRGHAAALAGTFASVATPRIRNQGTVGGNLAHADPAQDPPVTLLALDAVAVIRSAARSRTVPLEGFFIDLFETVLEMDELLVRIDVPALPMGARATYRKFLPRTRDDYATVSVAAVVARDDAGRCTHARVAIGGAGPVPFRAREAERRLLGGPLDDTAIREAGALAAAAADPIGDLRGSGDYKRAMAAVWTERALRELAA